MRLIKLNYNDFELFDISWTETNLTFYSSHKDTYRQMWKEQGKEFWLRYLLTYRSFSSHHDFIGRTAPALPHFSELVDWIFIQLHEIFVDGTFCDVKQLIEDISLFTQHRSVIGGLKYASRAKDPFYIPLTRDTYRRMFGNPEDKAAYARVIMFPLYEHFVISTFTCLRRWITAPEADPDDTSYWDQPPPAPTFQPAEPQKKRKGKKPPRFRTTTVPPSADFTMVDIRPLFKKEMSKGKPSGPVFVNGWPADSDPRFLAPVNPLYDPTACRDTDWRSKLDIVGYLRFSDFVAHQNGMLYRYVLESEEDENIFDEKVMQKIRGIKVEPDLAADDTASNDADEQTSSSCSKSSQTEEPGIVPQSGANVADKSALKKHSKKEVSGDNSSAEDSGAVNLSVDVSADQQSSKQPTSHVNLDEHVGLDTVTETSDATSSSSDKQNSTDSLRTCGNCYKQESTLHEFKKCKKCKELGVKDAKYYCGRECQLRDWTNRHRQEHRDWLQVSTAVASSNHE